MKPTEALKNEHGYIKEILLILDKIIGEASLRRTVPLKDLTKILSFIMVFVDKCHHGKEETILFPAMEEAGIPYHGGPIGVMLAEHEEGRRYVRAMSEAAQEYERGSPNALEKLAENARNYVSLLEQHIWKEDNVLFNLADEYIPSEIQLELVRKFKEFEVKEIGEEHENQLKALEKLREIYLSE